MPLDRAEGDVYSSLKSKTQKVLKIEIVKIDERYKGPCLHKQNYQSFQGGYNKSAARQGPIRWSSYVKF